MPVSPTAADKGCLRAPQVLHTNPGAYLQQRKHLVAMALHYAAALRVAQEVGHSTVSALCLPFTLTQHALPCQESG